MEAKKYKRMRWNFVRGPDMERVFKNIDVTVVDEDGDRVQSWCKVCKQIIFPNISQKSYYEWFFVKEQRHLDSKKHQYNLVLHKLAG